MSIVRNLMKKLFAIIFTSLLALSITSTAFASGDSACQPVYGGGEVCQNNFKFTINKMVQSPTKGGNYVENLTVNDVHYAPSTNIIFKITIKNTGDSDITNLNVTDTLPQYLTYVSGLANATSSGNNISFVVNKLTPGQSVDYILATKVSDVGSLTKTITCPVNKVSATAKDGSTATDESQVCIEKSSVTPTPAIMQKPPVTNIPSTGPETDILLGLITSGALGLFLRKKIS